VVRGDELQQRAQGRHHWMATEIAGLTFGKDVIVDL
jgi:hypothetical protein